MALLFVYQMVYPCISMSCIFMKAETSQKGGGKREDGLAKEARVSVNYAAQQTPPSLPA
jgi:hypothetical protein